MTPIEKMLGISAACVLALYGCVHLGVDHLKIEHYARAGVAFFFSGIFLLYVLGVFITNGKGGEK